jgi:hypothetical protein
MSLLLAAALAAQIHTGADLLAVCETQAKACEAFIEPAAECMLLVSEGETPRDVLVRFLKDRSAYQFLPAHVAVEHALGAGCE